MVSLPVQKCTRFLCSLSVYTEQYTLVCVVCLSFLNCTHWYVWSVFRYWTENFPACVPLSVLIWTFSFVWSLCRYWTVYFAVCGPSVEIEVHTCLSVVCLWVLKYTYWNICLYRTVNFAVCRLPSVIELYTLLCGLSFDTELYILQCGLFFCTDSTYCCLFSVCRYCTVHIVVRGLFVNT